MIDGVAYIIALHGVIAENRLTAQVFKKTPRGTKRRGPVRWRKPAPAAQKRVGMSTKGGVASFIVLHGVIR